MNIRKKGKYQLLEDIIIRTSNSVGTLSKGLVFEVTQVNEQNHNFYSPEIADWYLWDNVPAKEVK